MNIKNIVPELVRWMQIIGNHKNMSGLEKKEWVLLKVKEELELNEDIENLIIDFIDYIILVDGNKIIINQKIKNGCLSSLFCCKK
jgi:hypothetical protein